MSAVLVGLRPRHCAARPWPSYQQFTTSARRHQELAEPSARTTSFRDKEKSYGYRHIHPNGRIIGRPGRRQRESFEQLAINSLGKPSGVVVLHDVVEEPAPRPQQMVLDAQELREADQRASSMSLSGKDMGATATDTEQLPEQEQVSASIEALRPDTNVLDKGRFDAMVKDLLGSYNVRQLSRYLVQSLGYSSTAITRTGKQSRKAYSKMPATKWQPGRTPLVQRVGRINLDKVDSGNTKAKVADQIMRNAWGISIDSEEQRLGELEVMLTSWQSKMLFDLRFEDKPAISTFIDSPLLLRTSDVRPYRPDNVMRITARKRDAEEILAQLQRKLSNVHRLDVDLTVFKADLGRGNWPDKYKTLWKEDDLRYISERTGSVIEHKDGGKLAIYCVEDRAKYALQARRLLLSLLDLPYPNIITARSPSEGRTGILLKRHLKTYTCSDDMLALSTYPTQDVHRRNHGHELVRIVAPAPKMSEDIRALKPTSTHAAKNAVLGGPKGERFNRLLGLLNTVPESVVSHSSADIHDAKDSNWRLAQSSPWHADFCVLLRRAAETASLELPPWRNLVDNEDPFTAVHQVIGLAPTLSYFKPTKIPMPEVSPQDMVGSAPVDETARRAKPYLVAHFIPSPFTKRGIGALKFLPRVALSCRFDPATQTVQVIEVAAGLNRQEFQVPFPDQAMDITFSRTSKIHMKREREARKQKNPVFQEFTERLERSIKAGSGALDAMGELEIKLPWWVVRAKKKPWGNAPKEDTGVQYLLDRLEQVQTMEFMPNWNKVTFSKTIDREVKELVEDWPKEMVLRLNEVDAGASGGRRTELYLQPRAAASKILPDLSTAPPEASSISDENFGKPAQASAKTEAATNTLLSHARTLQLTTTATRLLKLLTRANSGDLKALTFDYDGSNRVKAELP
ncbi:hypothetical protein LTR08_003902 [Meristemomyces frigidus]|nr:hypothetical protein LTR08_003902 [Meristemomyces frigidus]